MAQAAIANQDREPPFTNSAIPMPQCLDSVLPKTSSSASSDALEIATLGLNLAQAKAAPTIQTNKIHVDHFVQLCELAESLGLANEVERVLCTNNYKADLTPFLTKLTEKIELECQQIVHSTLKEWKVSLYKAFRQAKQPITQSYFDDWFDANCSDPFCDLTVGISNEFQSVSDADDKLTLSLTTESLSILPLHYRHGALWDSVVQAVEYFGSEALAWASCNEILTSGLVYTPILDYYDFDNPKHDNEEEIWAKIVEDGYITDFFCIEDDEDDDEVEEIKESSLKLIRESLKSKKRVKVSDTWLSTWIKTNALKTDSTAYELLTHGLPSHFCSTSSVLTEILEDHANSGGFEESCSRFTLEPMKAIKYISDTYLNRCLLSMIDGMQYIGFEDETCLQYKNQLSNQKAGFKLFD
ncbi:hypothetical protein ACPV5U_19575 [Vibrio mediterranei]